MPARARFDARIQAGGPSDHKLKRPDSLGRIAHCSILERLTDAGGAPRAVFHLHARDDVRQSSGERIGRISLCCQADQKQTVTRRGAAARQSLQQTFPIGYSPAFALARTWLGLGDLDACPEWMKIDLNEHDPNLVSVSVFPAYDPLRSNERFIRLRSRLFRAKRRANRLLSHKVLSDLTTIDLGGNQGID